MKKKKKRNNKKEKKLRTWGLIYFRQTIAQKEHHVEPLNCFIFDHYLPFKTPLSNPQILIQWRQNPAPLHHSRASPGSVVPEPGLVGGDDGEARGGNEGNQDQDHGRNQRGGGRTQGRAPHAPPSEVRPQRVQIQRFRSHAQKGTLPFGSLLDSVFSFIQILKLFFL